MEFIPCTGGNKELLVFDGYIHSQNITSATGVRTWECVERRNEKLCTVKNVESN